MLFLYGLRLYVCERAQCVYEVSVAVYLTGVVPPWRALDPPPECLQGFLECHHGPRRDTATLHGG